MSKNLIKIFKNIIFISLFYILFISVILDLLFSTLLFIKKDTDLNEIFLQKWPAQFRLSNDDKDLIFNRNLKKNKIVDNFKYSSILGFFNSNYISIWINGEKISSLSNIETFKKTLELNKDKKIFIALGGSTTASSQSSNWPTHISEQLKNMVIINAGHNGYMSYQERVLLNEILLPLIDLNKIFYVVSLTGTNDISYSYNYYLAKQKFKVDNQINFTEIPNAYYMNDVYFDDLNKNKILNVNNLILNGNIIRKIFPATSYYFTRKPKREISSIFSFIGSLNKENVMIYCDLFVKIPQSYGAFTPGELLNIDKAKFYKKFIDLINSDNQLIKESVNQNVKDCSKNRNKKISLIKYANFSEQEKKRTADRFFKHHDDTYNLLKSKNIPYAAFFQPIKIKKNKLLKDIPNYDYNLVHWYKNGGSNGFLKLMPGIETFKNISEIITEENKSYLFDIHNIFENDKIDYFTDDNIHYTYDGSYLISKKIISLLNLDFNKQ